MRAGIGELADCGRCSGGGEDVKPFSGPNGEGPDKVLPKLNGWRWVSIPADLVEIAVVESPLAEDNDGLDTDGFLLLVNGQHDSHPAMLSMLLTQATPVGGRDVPGIPGLVICLSVRQKPHPPQVVR